MLAIISVFSLLISPFSGEHESHAKISSHTFQVHADTTDQSLQVSRIFIIGNKRTREQIIFRELSLAKGDTVQALELPAILDRDRKKLINTRLFTKVEIRALPLHGRFVDILIDVAERWYTFPSPVFELADRNFNEWWQNYNHDFHRVNYGLRLYQFNMRGRNETLRFLAQLGFQRKFEMVYRFPYIDKKQKQGLAVEVGYLNTENMSYRTRNHRYEFLMADQSLRKDYYGGFTYSYRRSFYKTHSLKFEYRSIQIGDTIKTLNPDFIKGEGRQSTDFSYITYQFNADHRDFFAYPLRGYHLQANLTKTGIGAGDDVNKWEILIVNSNHFNLSKNYYLSNNTVAYWSTPKDLSYVNYGTLGLRRQFVRGYELYVIEGPYHILNKTTFKKLIFSREYNWKAMPLEQFQHFPISIYLKTYFDFGYVRNYPDYLRDNVNTRLANKWLTGIGTGIDVVTSYDIVLRFEYSINAEKERGFFFHVKREF